MSTNPDPNQDEFKEDLSKDELEDDNFEDDDDYEYDDDYDEEIYGLGNFGNRMNRDIGANVKQFLAHYYGEEVMATLEAETYLEIEKIIKDAFYYGGHNIPDLLYLNRTISDDAFDEALEAYVHTPKTFEWPKRTDEWFERDFSDEDDDDHQEFETYIKESDPIDLTEEEKKVKKLFETTDNFLDHHSAFADFTNRGYKKLSVDIQQYLNNTITFDLMHLTPEGFKELEETIYWLITEMLNELFGAVNYDLKNKE